MSDKQTVFISWSKPLSMQVALALKEWLPDIFDKAEGWVSDVDIAAGAQTYNTIAGALGKSVFGIIIVTAVNQNEPWLNYEAGALSNKFHADQNCVAPLLVDLRKADLTSPLKQYQANDLDQAGILKVCKTLAPIMGTDIASVEKRVAKFWPELQLAVGKAREIESKDGHSAKPQKRDTDDIVAEVLTTVREISRRLDRPFKTWDDDAQEVKDLKQLFDRFVEDDLWSGGLVSLEHSANRRGIVVKMSPALPAASSDRVVAAVEQLQERTNTPIILRVVEKLGLDKSELFPEK